MKIQELCEIGNLDDALDETYNLIELIHQQVNYDCWESEVIDPFDILFALDSLVNSIIDAKISRDEAEDDDEDFENDCESCDTCVEDCCGEVNADVGWWTC